MKRRLTGSIIFCIVVLTLFTASPAIYSQVTEIGVGFDKGYPIVTGRYQLSGNYNLILQYIKDSPIGIGLTYTDSPWMGEILDMPSYLRMSVGYESRGSFNLQSDKTTGKLGGGVNFRSDTSLISGTFNNDSNGFRGNIHGHHRWVAGETSLAWTDKGTANQRSEVSIVHQGNIEDHTIKVASSWQIREDEESIFQNFSLDYGFNNKGHIVSLMLQANEYGTGRALIGKGVEALWVPPQNWLALGVGHFSEETTGVSSERYRVLMKYDFSYPLYNTTIGVNTTAEGFLYSLGQKRLEISADGFVRRAWDSGNVEVKLANVHRAGETPFSFDNNPERIGLIAQGRIQYRVGGVLSSLILSYDLQAHQWRRLQGNIQTILFDKASFRFSAGYDMNNTPKPDETVYIADLRYPGDLSIEGRVLMNYEFKPLEMRGKAEASWFNGKQALEIRYDTKKNQFDSITGSFTSSDMWRISIEYRPIRPSIMVIYQKLAW